MKLRLYFITLFITTILEWLWLVLVAQEFYRPQLENFLTDNLRYIVAAILYLLSTAVLFYLAVEPSFRADSLNQAAIAGGLLGLINSASHIWEIFTKYDWPLWFILAELAWWPIMSGATAAISVWMGKKVKPKNQAATI